MAEMIERGAAVAAIKQTLIGTADLDAAVYNAGEAVIAAINAIPPARFTRAAFNADRASDLAGIEAEIQLVIDRGITTPGKSYDDLAPEYAAAVVRFLRGES